MDMMYSDLELLVMADMEENDCNYFSKEAIEKYWETRL